MILNVRINNFMVFSNDVEMSFEADMHTKKFMENVYSQNNFNVVKSAVIYGANNVGKTCVLEAIRFIKGIMRGEAFIPPSGDLFNIYTESNELALGITFMLDNDVYSFDFKYLVDRTSKEGIVTYESLKEVSIDKTKKQKEKLIYTRDINSDSKFINSTYLTKLMKEVPHESIFLYQVEPQNKDAKEIIDKYRDIFSRFTDSVETVRLTTLQLSKTIDYLKKDGVEAKLIKELVCSIDTDISDISYKEDDINLPVLEDIEDASIREKRSKELLSLVSVHNGKEVRSMLYDSRGTKEIIALAGYIV
ncbi:MAG: ATP-binding protein, partial [Coprobacillus sp.]|nr:ATP-binding protein [Coprobacillus sp.]